MILATVLALLLILGLSAFFSGSETALMSVNPYRLRHLEEQNKVAGRVRRIIAYPERVLGTILTGNVFVNTAAGALLTYTVTLLVASPQEREKTIALATIGLTALILVFGEMVPKSFAARHPERWSLFVIGPITFLIKVLGPAVQLLTAVSNMFLKLVGERSQPLNHQITLEEIKAILFTSLKPENDRGRRREMLRKVIELGEHRVAEVMVPRTEIVAVNANAPLDDIVELIQKRRFSRMPVYRDSLDNINGLIYSKDIITYWGARFPFHIHQVLRKVYYLPDTAKVEQALEQMQKESVHMAIVVDEHGGVEGIVTIEDLLEEIVGELKDETDDIADRIQQLSDGSFLLDAGTPVKELNEEEAVTFTLPEEPDYNTVAGFVLTRLGRIPVEGEEIQVDSVLLTVDKVADRRILRIRARQRQ